MTMIIVDEIGRVQRLYNTNSSIREMIDYWVQERRCPMGLVDELLIEGLDDAADCALHAATVIDLPVYLPATLKGERDGECGLYPTMTSTNPDHETLWGWTVGDQSASDIPDSQYERNVSLIHPDFDTDKEAIIWLLDNWKKV